MVWLQMLNARSSLRTCWCRRRSGQLTLCAFARGGSEGDAHRLEAERRHLRGLRATELQHRLHAWGVAHPDGALAALDAEELVELLAQHVVQARSEVVRFKLQRSFGKANRRKSYLIVPVDVEGVGFMDFLIDSGTSKTLVTSSMRAELGVSPVSGNFMTGLDSSGLTVRQMISLPTLRLGSWELGLREAIVTRLNLSDDIGGVLGLSFLRQAEVDIDREAGTVAFHPIGHVGKGVLDVSGMSRVGLSSIKGAGGLFVASASLNGSAQMPAIVDLSANNSSINRAAARLAGIASDLYDLFEPSTDKPDSTFINPDALTIRLGIPEPSPSSPMQLSGLATDAGNGTASSSNEQVCVSSSEPIMLREMPSLAPLGFKPESPFMVIGNDIVCKRRAVLCFGSNAMYLDLPAEEKG